MKLIVLAEKTDKTLPLFQLPQCQEILQVYDDYYPKVGFHKPWVGYWVQRDGAIVGCGGFTGQPVDGMVEIAYGTFKGFEGQGIATFAAGALISIAKQTDPTLTITAKTAPEHNASNHILQKHGFEYAGIVQDHEIGDAWLWVVQAGTDGSQPKPGDSQFTTGSNASR